MKIAVTNSKPYIARVTGSSKQFGTANEFVRETERKSAGYRLWEITADGIYKCPAGDTRIDGIGRIDTGFFRIEGGNPSEITRDEALAAFA